MINLKNSYSVCVVDIGSPKLGNIGWCFIDARTAKTYQGKDLDELITLMQEKIKEAPILLGLEAPLFVPLREDILLATKARKGEERRPWSAGAGAQVLSMNLPIMTYLFRKMQAGEPNVKPLVDYNAFAGIPYEVLVFEALVSGSDKGSSHEEDAKIMADYCFGYSQKRILPPTILGEEEGVSYFNLVGAALLRCGLVNDLDVLEKPSLICKPTAA